MDVKELNWLRTNINKIDRDLRFEIVKEYRSLSKIPCFLQKLFRIYQKTFRKIPVIVQFNLIRGDQDSQQFRTLIKKHNRRVTELKIINSYSTKLSISAIQKVSSHSSVMKVYLDKEIRTLLNKATPTVMSKSAWEQGYTGKGVTIAVLDTGVYPHPDFLQPENRIVAFKDFVNKKDSFFYDDNGHGTHCAGAALGNGYSSQGTYKGPAYMANLVAVKILDKMGSGKSSQAIKALEWCLENRNKYKIKVISLSFGTKATESYREDPLCQAVEELWHSGLVVCVAAGNDGPDEKTITTPGIHPAIITVGASDDKNTTELEDDSVAVFSSRGPTVDGLTKPDLLAPGTNIVAAKARGSFIDKVSKKDAFVGDWYISLSGTSMATPICAGIIAQLLEKNPTLTPAQVKKILQATGFKLASYDANAQGNGCINALRAINEPSYL